MGELLRTLLNRSLSAGLCILAVLILRFLLKKAPKWLHCLLWAIVALRLILPALPESALSLNPRVEPVPPRTETVTVQTDTGTEHIQASGEPFAANAETPPAPSEPAKRTDALTVLGWVWLAGACLMLGYAAFSTVKLRRRVGASVRETGNIYLCDGISSPFILGVFFPRIYLPSGIEADTRAQVLAHERAHLSRGDQLWKPLGWLLLSVYWFHPLMWLGYVLLCRDIELACDEKVVRGMEKAEKAAYSQALLDCSLPRRMVTACPLAFGETDVKTRVKNVLNYRKPALWVILAAIALMLAAAVCFLTKPKEDDIFGYRYQPTLFGRWVTEPVALSSDDVHSAIVDADGNLYLKLTDGSSMKAGQLEVFRPTKRNFGRRYPVGDGRIPSRSVRWACRCLFTPPGWEHLCFADLLELRSGKTLLVVGWQDEEGLTDPDSDDSSVWWYAELRKAGEPASAVRPGVQNASAAVLYLRNSAFTVTVTSEIDSLKTFDSLILEPTGEVFDEAWEYRIVFDPVSVVKDGEPIEVLFGAESVGIDGWKYTAPKMAGALEWAEGKYRYFVPEEPADEVTPPAPEPEPWQAPPMLSVTGDGSPLQLWRGTYSWYHFQGGAEMDCMTPGEVMTRHPENIPTLTACAGGSVTLSFESGGPEPGSMKVFCYAPSQWDELSPEGSQLKLSEDGSVALPDGEYLYVVSAGWNDETYQGSCLYAFYCDSRSAKTGVVERMGSASPETVLVIFSRFPVDEAALCEALRRASEAGPVEAPEAFNACYEVEVYFSGGPAGYTGEDEHLHLRAGLEPGIVEVYYKPRLGKSETRYFRDEALVDIVRGSCASSDSVDTESYGRYGAELEARAAEVLERLSRRAGAGAFTGYTITELTPLDAFTEDGTEYEVYRWDAAFTCEEPQDALRSDGTWLDSLGRVRGAEPCTVFAVRHGENGDETAFLGGTLYDDTAAGRAAVLRLLN